MRAILFSVVFWGSSISRPSSFTEVLSSLPGLFAVIRPSKFPHRIYARVPQTIGSSKNLIELECKREEKETPWIPE